MVSKKFVVPLDGSPFAERALPVAEALAERVGGGLLLVSAQYHGLFDLRGYLEACAHRQQRCPVEIVTTEATDPAETIVETLEGHEDRIVCMTTHGRGRLRWAVMGSVAEDVIRRAGRPMLLVGRHCRPDFLTRASHLLACTDGSDGSEELAAAVQEWTQLLGLDLQVTVVTHPLDVENTAHPEALTDAIVAPFGDANPSSTILHGSYVAGALADFADDLPATIVAINSKGRAGLPRLALGSVTMGLLNLAPCPLLVTHRIPNAA